MQFGRSLFFGRQRPASLKRQGMYRSVLEGMLATVHVTLVQGAFLTNFALFLGANNFTISVITAVPFVVQASFFLSPILTGKFHSRRKVAAICSAIGRSLWLFSGAIAFAPMGSGAKAACFIAALATGSALEVIGQNAWQSWMADLVPRAVRGAFHSWRNIYTGVVALVVTAGGAAFMDLYRREGMEAHGYLGIFSVAVLFALCASFVLWRQHEPPEEAQLAMDVKRLFLMPWRDTRFRPLLKFFGAWNFSLGVAGSFFGVYMKTYLGWSFTKMGWFSNTVAVVSLLLMWVWGRQVDRHGPLRVLRRCGLAVCLLPLTWIATSPDVQWPAWANAVLSGILWSGFNIAAFNLAQWAAPAVGRQYYLGLLSTVNGVGMLTGLLVGGVIAQWMPFELASVGSWTFVSFHLLFFISGAGRFLSLRFLPGTEGR
jgi:MFS family permease